MNRKWWKLIYMLPITFCTLYAGGYVAQFIRCLLYTSDAADEL